MTFSLGAETKYKMKTKRVLISKKQKQIENNIPLHRSIADRRKVLWRDNLFIKGGSPLSPVSEAVRSRSSPYLYSVCICNNIIEIFT